MSDNAVQIFDPKLPVTREDLSQAAERRKMLKEFVQSQMVVNVDYGIIPGTPKPSLYQPGAQKLAQLFAIGVRFVNKEKEVNLHENFAMFTYTAEVYHLRTGTVIAQCEGSCNSQEKKYRTQKVDGALQERPIGDLMNTLMKMAQKRAYVGGIIQATGASDFYTQDIDDAKDAETAGVRPPPRTVQSAVPRATSARSTDETQAPVCCDRPMMVSKFHKDSWYCVNCKNVEPFT
jgi:hypothetical protein